MKKLLAFFNPMNVKSLLVAALLILSAFIYMVNVESGLSIALLIATIFAFATVMSIQSQAADDCILQRQDDYLARRDSVFNNWCQQQGLCFDKYLVKNGDDCLFVAYRAGSNNKQRYVVEAQLQEEGVCIVSCDETDDAAFKRIEELATQAKQEKLIDRGDLMPY